MTVEILEDVQEECSKYGQVLDLKIPRPAGGSRQSAGVGKIFVKFDTVESATKALILKEDPKIPDDVPEPARELIKKLLSKRPILRPALSDVLKGKQGVPEQFDLLKVLVFKPKTAKTATPVPVVIIAGEETETNANAVGKKLNLKELRLASEDLLKDFFGVDKDSRE